MLLRVVFFVLMALGLIGFGTVAWIATRPPPPAAAGTEPPPLAKKTVLTAARALRAGTLLKPEDVGTKELPVADDADVTVDTPDARRALAGSMIRRSFSVDEPLHAADLMKPGDHGFLAAVLQPGMRAITIGVDATSGSAGLIWPGDRVDLILTQALAGTAVPAGRRVAAETVLINARVIAIDQLLVQGAAPTGGDSRTVTLEVTQSQAEHVSVAMRLGRLSLSVRSAETAAAPDAAGPNTTWAHDVSPALTVDSSPSAEVVIRVFQGAGDVHEFKVQ